MTGGQTLAFEIQPGLIDWLLESGEPWTRYRTLVDLLDRPEDDAGVQSARASMIAHPQVAALVAEVSDWPGFALKRHNDARHPIHKLSTLADFGLRAAELSATVEAIVQHQAPEGAFQSLLTIPERFGGSGLDEWQWMACDAPVLLTCLLAFGLHADPRVQGAVAHLAGLVTENGWRCVSAPELGRFRGPGRKDDPCPIANLYALKALSLVPELQDSPATRQGAEMLLWHWDHPNERKLYLFGIGTDFRKPKYPFVWYDILHATDVLSRFPFVHGDPRLAQMIETLANQADAQGRVTARSMYRAWSGWSFADKKRPSPWLTFLALRVIKRVYGSAFDSALPRAGHAQTAAQ
jgi:hypothetical protein